MSQTIKTVFVVMMMLLSRSPLAQTEPNGSIDSIDISVEIKKSDTPMFLAIDQTEAIRTRADGFEIGASNRFRAVATAHITWQPSDIYEIYVYTNNIENLGLKEYLDLDKVDIKSQMARIDTYTGLYPRPPLGGTVYLDTLLLRGFVPFKVWVPLTALWGQTTAPVNSDGSIDKKYIAPESDEPQDYLCFYTVPEKLAIDGRIGTLGSYRKVVASAFHGTFPYRAELTFGLDLWNQNLVNNQLHVPHGKYQANVIIDMASN